MNDSDSSPDFLIGYRLIGRKIIGDPAGADGLYYTIDGSDPRLSGGAVNPAAIKYQQFTVPDQRKHARPRADLVWRHEWSPIVDAFYLVAPPTWPSPKSTINPYDPTDVELALPAELDERRLRVPRDS